MLKEQGVVDLFKNEKPADGVYGLQSVLAYCQLLRISKDSILRQCINYTNTMLR